MIFKAKEDITLGDGQTLYIIVRTEPVSYTHLLIYEMKKREIELQTRLDEAEAKLQAREITIEKAGSIADAAVQLSGVFQAAQEAADSYLKSIKAKEKELARLTKQAKKNMRD